MANLAYFTLKEASSIIGLSPNKLRREIHEGELNAMLVGIRYVLGEEDIREFMKSRRGLKSKAGRSKGEKDHKKEAKDIECN